MPFPNSTRGQAKTPPHGNSPDSSTSAFRNVAWQSTWTRLTLHSRLQEQAYDGAVSLWGNPSTCCFSSKSTKHMLRTCRAAGTSLPHSQQHGHELGHAPTSAQQERRPHAGEREQTHDSIGAHSAQTEPPSTRQAAHRFAYPSERDESIQVLEELREEKHAAKDRTQEQGGTRKVGQNLQESACLEGEILAVNRQCPRSMALTL